MPDLKSFPRPVLLLSGFLPGALLLAACSPRVNIDALAGSYDEKARYSELKITSPLDATVFPSDLAPFTFSWQDPAASDSWLLAFKTADKLPPLVFMTHERQWTPNPQQWETLKERSLEKPASALVLGFQRKDASTILSAARVSISTSKDPVGAPLFYREVILPFMEAVKDPSRIRWRFGSVSSLEPPPVVLDKLPVCGNCHSFSADGQLLGMDVDYANNKGSYVLTRVAKEMPLAATNVMTWDGYKPEDGEQTFGLLSQVSPDGRVAISTVKDKSVFVAKPDLAFSQLFFPIKGILVVYDRQTGAFKPLPGADDPEFVQSNPSWSPDGKYVVFARSPAYKLNNPEAQKKLLLSEADCAEFLKDGKPFKFDLYRVPYNDGKGGQAEPLKGASKNGRSNFFAKYSPDNKWIVFCQASNYMLLQPDSELFIVPAEGGEARRLHCNTGRMNSWHSWSANGRWLVFSSKANSPYTQLFLTHIDEEGGSTPAVVLSRFTSPDRAANIPEFVNAGPDAIVKVHQQFLDDYSHARAAYTLEMSGEIDQAIASYRKALEVNPRNVHAHQRLGFLLFHAKQQQREGVQHTLEALKLDPKNAPAHYDLGVALKTQGKLDPAMEHLRKAIKLAPERIDNRYNPASFYAALGDVLVAKGQAREGAEALQRSLKEDPRNARSHYILAMAQAVQGQTEEAVLSYTAARSISTAVDTAPEFHFVMSVNYEKAGNPQESLHWAETALQMAEKAGDPAMVEAFRERVRECRRAPVLGR